MLKELLYDQEVFHQKILERLLATTPLAQELGLCKGGALPQVKAEPCHQLFDIQLYGPGLNDGTTKDVLIELKVASPLPRAQEAKQRSHIAKRHSCRRAYILLGSSYYCWQDELRVADRTSVIDRIALAAALDRTLGALSEGPLRELTLFYRDALRWDAPRWDLPYSSEGPLARFRFFYDLRAKMGCKASLYGVSRTGGQDLILHPQQAWRAAVPPLPVKGVSLFWEIVERHVRFKIGDVPKANRKKLRQEFLSALKSAASGLGIRLAETKERTGETMTLAQLPIDIFALVLRDGQIDATAAQGLFRSCEELLQQTTRIIGATVSSPPTPPAAFA